MAMIKTDCIKILNAGRRLSVRLGGMPYGLPAERIFLNSLAYSANFRCDR